MRTIVIISLFFFLISSNIWSQEKESFTYVKETEHFIVERQTKGGPSIDRLTPKQDNLQIAWREDMHNTYFIRYSDKVDPVEFSALIREELTKPYWETFLQSLSKGEMEKVKRVYLHYYFDINQKFIGYSIETPAKLLDRYPQLESLFHRWGQGVKQFDFSRYAIRIDRADRFGYGTLSISPNLYINRFIKER